VTLDVLIRAEGFVSDARVIRSSGYSQLDSAAVVSAGYWDFLPAIKSGSPIDAWKMVKVHLAPKDSGPESPGDEFGPELPNVIGMRANGVSRSPGTMDAVNPPGAQPASAAASALPPEAPRSSIEYPSVAAALAALHSKPGVVFSTQDGWTIAEDTTTKTIWSFPPKDNPAYPSMAKRYVDVSGGASYLKTAVVCEATRSACEDLARQLQQLNTDLATKMHQ